MSNAIAAVMLGCGNFSRRYHVPALLADPEVALAAIFDPSPSPAVHALAAQTGAALLDRLDALPRPPGRTMAIVTTPHALHAAHVAFALDQGWNVLCDKPFVLTAAEAGALATRAESRGLVNAVAFNRRLDRGCRRARDIIRAGGIGAGGIGAVRYVETIQLGYEREGWFLVPELGGGGPFTGRGTHMADIVPWLLDRAPTRLRARLRPGPPGRVDHGGFIDLQFADLECRMTCIEEGWHMWDEIRIFGEDGMIELRRPLHLPIGWALSVQTRRGAAGETLAADPTPGDATRDFLTALRTGARPACSFRDAILSAAIVEAAFNSARGDGGWLPLG